MQNDDIEITLIAKAIGLCLVLFSIMYPIGSLMFASFNISTWNNFGRGLFVLAWAVASIFFSTIWFLTEEEKENR